MTQAITIGERHVQVRGLASIDGGNAVKGYVARFRDDDFLSGSPANPIETVVDLGENALIEKNHFILYKDRDDVEIIAYQAALEGTHISAMANYLTLLFGADDVVHFDEILNVDAYQALMSGGVIKAVDFRIAKPRSRRMAPDPEDTWTQKGFEYMNSSGATSFEAKILTRAHGRGLLSDVRQHIKRLLSSPLTKKLKVKMSDMEEAIDLMAERVTQRITVLPVDGRITSDAVHDGIKVAKHKAQPMLDAYFGAKNEVLD